MSQLHFSARELSRRNWLNRIDPVYVLLDRVVFARLFEPRKAGNPTEFEKLENADIDFLVENLRKHRLVLWLNVLLATYLKVHGLSAIAAVGDSGVVVSGLLAPAMVTGAAWYTVSFGGIPEKFVSTALVLTFWMFLAFSLSMTLLTALLCSLTPWPVGAFVLCPIYAGLYVSSMLYDNMDGLKIGLDSTLLKFSRASLNYYQKHGFITREETHAEVYEGNVEGSQLNIAIFTHYITMLERSLGLLEAGKKPQVANQLIVSSLDYVFSIIRIYSPEPDRKLDKAYRIFLRDAHSKSVDDVNKQATEYLEKALEWLEPEERLPARELDNARVALAQFKAMQEQQDTWVAKGKDPQMGPLSQELADYLFVQVFQLLLSLMKANRHKFFTVTIADQEGAS